MPLILLTGGELDGARLDAESLLSRDCSSKT